MVLNMRKIGDRIYEMALFENNELEIYLDRVYLHSKESGQDHL